MTRLNIFLAIVTLIIAFESGEATILESLIAPFTWFLKNQYIVKSVKSPSNDSVSTLSATTTTTPPPSTTTPITTTTATIPTTAATITTTSEPISTKPSTLLDYFLTIRGETTVLPETTKSEVTFQPTESTEFTTETTFTTFRSLQEKQADSATFSTILATNFPATSTVTTMNPKTEAATTIVTSQPTTTSAPTHSPTTTIATTLTARPTTTTATTASIPVTTNLMQVVAEASSLRKNDAPILASATLLDFLNNLTSTGMETRKARKEYDRNNEASPMPVYRPEPEEADRPETVINYKPEFLFHSDLVNHLNNHYLNKYLK